MRLAFAVAALALTAASTAVAQTQPYEQRAPQSDWTVDVGVGALYGQDSDGDTGGQTNVIPYVAVNWRDTVYLNGFEGLGWNVVKTDTFRAGVQIRPRFGSDDIEGLTLDRPDTGADAAVYAYQRMPGNIVVGGRVSRDVSDVSEGTEYIASIGRQSVTRVGLLSTSAFVRGGDAKLAQAYYGVTPAEGIVNGIPAYAPDGGLQGAGVNVLLIAPLTERWAIGGLASYERRLGDVADSPLSRNDDAWRVGAFVARRFNF